MATPESKVKAAIRARLESYGLRMVTKAPDADGDIPGFFFMPVAGPYSVHGIHDFIGCWRGLFFTVEAKAPNNPDDGTPAQLDFQLAVTKSGGLSYVGARDASVVDDLHAKVHEWFKVRLLPPPCNP